MTDEPTCCGPREDTFLAVTEIKPIGVEKPEKTEMEKRRIERELIDCLRHPKQIRLEL
ncbi:MAG: hypothetical protein NC430_08045 [bacterium]|nr:hypothetical protein [bacterium]